MYDTIIVGSSIYNLIYGIKELKNNKKVLIIESNSYAGKLSSSFSYHGYSFDRNNFELLNYDDLFKKLNIKIDTKSIGDNIISYIDSKKYEIPLNKEEFINKMEEYNKGSSIYVNKFLDICKEVNDIPNHKYKSYRLLDVYKELKIPKKVQYILNSFYLYLGKSLKEVRFLEYSNIINSYLNNNVCVPVNGFGDITESLLDLYRSLNGDILFNTNIKSIDNNVVTIFNEEYKADNIIINNEIHNKEYLSLYLVIDKTMEELKLNNYLYFIYNDLNMSKIYNDNLILHIKEEDNKTIINISTFITNNVFERKVNLNNYFRIKDEICINMITLVEYTLNINIMDNILESIILTPVDYMKDGINNISLESLDYMNVYEKEVEHE